MGFKSVIGDIKLRVRAEVDAHVLVGVSVCGRGYYYANERVCGGAVFPALRPARLDPDHVALEVMHSLGAIHVLHGKWYASFLTI